MISTLCRIRRRKASSTRSLGSRLVENMVSCSKGTWNCWPEASDRIVDAIFQRHDPAIEQFLGTAQLPAEVVDEEDAAVRLDVHRHLIIVRLGRVIQVEHGQVQFAAGDDDRPLDLHPALIDGAGVEQPPNGRLVVFQARRRPSSSAGSCTA